MGLLFGKIGYYLVLGWCCMSIFVFMVNWGSREHELEDTGPWADWVLLKTSKQRMSGGEFRPELHC